MKHYNLSQNNTKTQETQGSNDLFASDPYYRLFRGEMARYLGQNRMRLSALAPLVGVSVKTMYMRYNAPETLKLSELRAIERVTGLSFLKELEL